MYEMSRPFLRLSSYLLLHVSLRNYLTIYLTDQIYGTLRLQRVPILPWVKGNIFSHYFRDVFLFPSSSLILVSFSTILD